MAKIYFDFDDVLFDTARFTRDYQNFLMRECHITRTQCKISYQKARERPGIKNYYFLRHMAILSQEYGCDQSTLLQQVRIFLEDTTRYVFRDAVETLTRLKHAKHRLFLVTFGARDFQKMKVMGSGLAPYFSAMRMGEIPKAQMIQEIEQRYPSGGPAVYCEDRIVHLEDVFAHHPDMYGVLVARPTGHYYDVHAGETFIRQQRMRGFACTMVHSLTECESAMKDVLMQ